MADYDRYQEQHRGYRGRYRDRDREARLDDRTGMSPGSPGGYRARFDEDRELPGYREQNYNMHADESRSFSNEDYGSGQRGADYSRGEAGYGGRGGHGGEEVAGGGPPQQRFGEPGETRGRGYQSYPFSPYQDYAGPESYGGQSYGDSYGQASRARSLEANRGDLKYPYGGGRADSTGYRPGAPYQGRPATNEEPRHWWDRAAERVYSWFGEDDGRQTQATQGRQSNRGRGPKGYRRSDERIREDVSDRLTDDHWLDASAIEVAVVSAEVVLTGTVKNRDDKRRAENLAEAVSGVDNVQNNLRIERSDWRADGSTGASTTGEAGARDGPLDQGRNEPRDGLQSGKA